MYVQELRNANASFLQKNVCVPVEEKQNLKNSKHSLPTPTFGMDKFLLAKFFISALSKVDD